MIKVADIKVHAKSSSRFNKGIFFGIPIIQSGENQENSIVSHVLFCDNWKVENFIVIVSRYERKMKFTQARKRKYHTD